MRDTDQGEVAILIESMTDNRNRTVAEVRHALTKYLEEIWVLKDLYLIFLSKLA